jgi:hypothetical protein
VGAYDEMYIGKLEGNIGGRYWGERGERDVRNGVEGGMHVSEL